MIDAKICNKGEMRIDGRCVHAKDWAERNLNKLRLYDDVYDELMKHNPTHSWHEEMVMYKEVWEHPDIKRLNRGRNVLGEAVCTLYQSDYDKKFLFVIGKMGSTTNLIFEGE